MSEYCEANTKSFTQALAQNDDFLDTLQVEMTYTEDVDRQRQPSFNQENRGKIRHMLAA